MCGIPFTLYNRSLITPATQQNQHTIPRLVCIHFSPKKQQQCVCVWVCACVCVCVWQFHSRENVVDADDAVGP